MFEILVRETNAYAARVIETNPNHQWKDVKLEEMKAFLGIYMYISVIKIPNYSIAWTSMWPFWNPSISEIMTRSRFEHISKHFRCNDVSQNPLRRAPGHDIQAIPTCQTHKIRYQNSYCHEFQIYTGKVEGGIPEKGL